ncbi:uncharacterized protein CC84DRAFT_1165786 [Paraphaeosphaeria sporulosa]|uniref:Uncharacterized protein n=1 Tax=Paraphaeosphaeria sporulosa TaxID=1460663 RepID=A0A177C9V7_9PLEO|nr:uncharacterized protein CC84DRAFT_1165786 [Paraphaeosphaeria sporulosa]OAG03558.1 hypothetical protein CC84DRAFT_1165786 [Paraphaeosphaeria sporulosa]
MYDFFLLEPECMLNAHGTLFATFSAVCLSSLSLAFPALIPSTALFSLSIAPPISGAMVDFGSSLVVCTCGDCGYECSRWKTCVSV